MLQSSALLGVNRIMCFQHIMLVGTLRTPLEHGVRDFPLGIAQLPLSEAKLPIKIGTLTNLLIC